MYTPFHTCRTSAKHFFGVLFGHSAEEYLVMRLLLIGSILCNKVQMCKVQIYKLQMPKLQMSMLVIHHHQLLISQFLKILLKDFGELMPMHLILVYWNMILDYIVRYENMMLITEMKRGR